jgi:activator of the mannose operon (transcriptional antiterminator)
LLKNKETLTIDEIATELKCSEKTIRNDFKEIDEWLSKNFEAKIIRKPNLGVKLEITEEEKKKILSNTTNVSMSFEVHTNEGERKIEILSLLLKDNKIPSIQSLSEAFYVSKT